MNFVNLLTLRMSLPYVYWDLAPGWEPTKNDKQLIHTYKLVHSYLEVTTLILS